MYNHSMNKERRRENTHIGSLAAKCCRVAVAAAVVLLLAVGLQGRVARVLEKAAVSVSDDGLA